MKKSVRLFSPDFDLLSEVDDYESFVFTRRFSDIGSFEVVINKNKINAKWFKRGNIFYLSNTKVGIIEFVETIFGGSTGEHEKLTVKGFTLERLLTFRVCAPNIVGDLWRMSGFAEDLIKQMVRANLGDLASFIRKIPNFIVLPSKKMGTSITFEAKRRPLDECVSKICLMGKIGYSVRLDLNLKQFILDTYTGNDLTTAQTSKPAVIFSLNFNNIYEQTLTDSFIDYKNVLVFENGNADIFSGSQAPTGINRREILGNAGENNAIKLAEMTNTLSLDGKINPDSALKYGTHYDLGDTTTLIAGVDAINARIVEITETFDVHAGYRVSCVFGDKQKTLVDKLKSTFSDLHSAIKNT